MIAVTVHVVRDPSLAPRCRGWWHSWRTRRPGRRGSQSAAAGRTLSAGISPTAVGADTLSAGVEQRELQRRQCFVYASGDASHAISDGGAGIGEIADQHSEYLLAWPGFSRESTESAPGDAAGGAVIGAVGLPNPLTGARAGLQSVSREETARGDKL